MHSTTELCPYCRIYYDDLKHHLKSCGFIDKGKNGVKNG